MTTKRGMLISGAAILAVIAICGAQQPAKFTEFQRRNIPGTQLDGVTTVAEIPPGVSSARHSHPGEDFGYVIEGTIVLRRWMGNRR